MKKKFAIVFLSLLLVVSLPFAAHANIVTATGKYIINAVKHAPGGAKVEATNTATAAKHVIKHGVSSADLGKSIGAGIVGFGVGTGAGLAFKAITGLALDAVDWVLDPANNSVRYTDDAAAGGSLPQYVWTSKSGAFFSTPEEACRSSIASFGYSYTSIVYVNDSHYWCHGSRNGEPPRSWTGTYSNVNPDYVESTPKYIPIDTVAAKIIELADSGNAAAQKDVEDHVYHKAQNGDLDNELDNATDITEPENPDEPNPEEPEQCPSGTVKVDDVCVKIPDSEGDEPLFCDSSEFTKKVCDWIDWTQTEHDEPESDSGNVDIIDKSEGLNIDQNRIDFTNQCPAPTPINTSVGGFPVSTELNYQPLCDFFTMLNPFVIGMGGISSALIIAGGARRG